MKLTWASQYCLLEGSLQSPLWLLSSEVSQGWGRIYKEIFYFSLFLSFISEIFLFTLQLLKKKKKTLNSFFWILELVKCRFQLKELHAIRTRIYHRLKLANLSHWSSQFLMGWLPDSFWFRSTFRSLKW